MPEPVQRPARRRPVPVGRGILWLLCAAAAAAAVRNVLMDQPLSWWSAGPEHAEAQAVRAGVQPLGPAAAQAMMEEQDALVLDARPRQAFDRARLPGALSLPAEAFDDVFPALQPFLRPARPVLVYCSDETCDEAFRAARRLRVQGAERVYVLAGGLRAWRREGRPLAPGGESP